MICSYCYIGLLVGFRVGDNDGDKVGESEGLMEGLKVLYAIKDKRQVVRLITTRNRVYQSITYGLIVGDTLGSIVGLKVGPSVLQRR